MVFLLATFTHKGAHHFLFPYAEDDLQRHWEQIAPKRNVENIRWIASQSSGLLGALEMIHEPSHIHQESELLNPNTDSEKRYGRPGDIRPTMFCGFEPLIRKEF